MPELPEVETTRSGLEKNIIGKKILAVTTSDKRLRLPFPQSFISDLENKKIVAVSRRARYLLIKLSSNKVMLVHLGMSGSLIYYQTKPTEALNYKHNHCVIKFSDNSYKIYHDPRRFGLIDLIDQDRVLEHKMLKDLGPEPFNKKFNVQYLQRKLQGKKINIKTAMMDNKIVVGVGNIYINEVLFASRISPLKNSNDLNNNEIRNLISNIKIILDKAIRLGGSTLRDYTNSYGDLGEFQFNLQVYGRDQQKCYNCGSLIKRIKQNGRSSFYCSNCQKS